MSRLPEDCPGDHTDLVGDLEAETVSVELRAMQVMTELVVYGHARMVCHHCHEAFTTPVRLFAAEGSSLGSSWEEAAAAIAGVVAQA